MPIPDFDSNSVIPPNLGDPRKPSEISPYPCTSLELCERFSSSPERIKILDGLLRLRAKLRLHGMMDGFQWIDGSFLEDVEQTESRPPNDIDVVTFYWNADPDFANKLIAAFPEIRDHDKIRTAYFVDHYPIDVGFHPEVTVAQASYWCGLFSHTRSSVWKGMLRIDLNTPLDDTKASEALARKP